MAIHQSKKTQKHQKLQAASWDCFLQRILEISVLRPGNTAIGDKDRLWAQLLKVVGYVNQVPLVLFKDEACVAGVWPRTNVVLGVFDSPKMVALVGWWVDPLQSATDQPQSPTTFPLKSITASLGEYCTLTNPYLWRTLLGGWREPGLAKDRAVGRTSCYCSSWPSPSGHLQTMLGWLLMSHSLSSCGG